MAAIRASHPAAEFVGVVLDGEVLRGKKIYEADPEAGTVICCDAEDGIKLSDRYELEGEVRFYLLNPYITKEQLVAEYPEFTGYIVDKPST